MKLLLIVLMLVASVVCAEESAFNSDNFIYITAPPKPMPDSSIPYIVFNGQPYDYYHGEYHNNPIMTFSFQGDVDSLVVAKEVPIYSGGIGSYTDPNTGELHIWDAISGFETKHYLRIKIGDDVYLLEVGKEE